MFASRRAGNGVNKSERMQLSDGSSLEGETRSTGPGIVELRGCPGRFELDWV